MSVLGRQPMGGIEPHGKMMIIDEPRAILGSTALSTLSLDFRREVSIVIHDPALVKQLNLAYQQLSLKAGAAGGAPAWRSNRMTRLLLLAALVARRRLSAAARTGPSTRTSAQGKRGLVWDNRPSIVFGEDINIDLEAACSSTGARSIPRSTRTPSTSGRCASASRAT